MSIVSSGCPGVTRNVIPGGRRISSKLHFLRAVLNNILGRTAGITRNRLPCILEMYLHSICNNFAREIFVEREKLGHADSMLDVQEALLTIIQTPKSVSLHFTVRKFTRSTSGYSTHTKIETWMERAPSSRRGLTELS